MVLNAAVQMLREAEELKQNILKFNNGTSMLQDNSLWSTQQQLQKVYQKVLMLDLDYALEKKVEQDLWNVGFKQQIEALQAISKDRKNQLKSEAQSMLSWVLQAAAGFYLCLLHQICSSFKLDLPFRRRASLLGAVEGWEASPSNVGVGSAAPGAARYACQHCLVHLGDLARYRQQLRVAHTFYRHALAVSVHSGQPYNQLALVSWRRGRRLAAVYWHVRSLLVRAPFPPAPANLARTLAAAASRDVKEAPPLPVLPGITTSTVTAKNISERLDSHTYVNELVRTVHYLHSVEQLEAAADLVNNLNTSLSSLIATDSFDSMTLIKMACVLIWLVHSATEDFSDEALSSCEARAAHLAHALAADTSLAMLLPAYSADEPPRRVLPALKIWLHWIVHHPKVVSSKAWASRPQLWAALAYVFNKLSPVAKEYEERYDAVPLPEDEELNGFLPLEEAFNGLKFNNSSWESNKLPDHDINDDEIGSTGISSLSLIGEPELEHRVRAARLLRLGRRLAERHGDHLSLTINEDGTLTFEASKIDVEQLQQVLDHLNTVRTPVPPEPLETEDSPDTSTPVDPCTPLNPSPSLCVPQPPVIISEADFREKVREKRVGILKPQGSLERAREERALATTQEEPEAEAAEESISEDKKETRKPRVNIAMAAIMRKQEETNKQVKFVTPPPTPDSTGDVADTKEDKPKVIQPKAIKSLTNLPIGRKTGGILSLKDKSAGYPHLQNTDPEPKKTEKEEKKESKPNQSVSPNSQNYQKREQSNWPAQSYDAPRMTFQKNYGIQNAGLSYNPNYQNNQGIKLPVVNPKEIDVRTAALQKQSSRQELFQDSHKFNQNYQISGDKKNFLNDLPPRFANQYRYWQNAQDSQFNENKFRDDTVKNNVSFNTNPRQNWPSDSQMQWWKPENQPNFSPQNFASPPVNLPNFYSSLPTNMPNPYANMPFNQTMSNLGQNMPSLGQNMSNLNQNMPNMAPSSQIKPENMVNYQQAIGQPHLQNIQNMVTTPNFNSNLNTFSYNPSVSYDSSMYPHFNSFHQLKMEKPFQSQGKESDTLNFVPNALDMQRNLNYADFGDGAMKPLDEQQVAGSGEASTYSLFSGAPDAGAWPPRQQQSLWSGPGPSPLERLLEQQKQMKPSPH